MLFPTHLAAGWLIGRWLRLSPWWIVLGAALPDLIDKPLAMLGVVELFQTIGHSLFFAGVILLILWDARGLAVGIGWVSHLSLDAIHMLVNGRPGDLAFLGWPLIQPADPLGLAPLEFLVFYVWTPAFFLEVGIWILTLAVAFRAYSNSLPAASD